MVDIHPRDKSVRTILGDAASATLVQTVNSDHERIGPFVYGTDVVASEGISDRDPPRLGCCKLAGLRLLL